MDFRTAAYRRRVQRLATSTGTCFRRGWLGMGNLAFAGSLAEQLFLRDHGSADPSSLIPASVPEGRTRSESLSYFVVRQSPAEARAVLGTAPASSEERAALHALRPAIAACLQGAEEAQLNRPGLRSLVALALYHLVRGSARGRAN